MTDQPAAGGGVRHLAWLYRTPGEYLAAIRDFVQADEPALVAVPACRLPPGWGPPGERPGTRHLDAAELGRNPARVMSAVREFADEHPGQRVRVVSELAWAGRSAAERGEVARYDMMVNLAFAHTPITMLCLYDAAGADGSAIAAACHPWLRQGGRVRPSGEYQGAQDVPHRPAPLPAVPGSAQLLSYRHDLRPVRAFVAAAADRAALSGPRRTDLVIAASEVAANTLKHTSGAGTVSLWITPDELLCQFDDSGHIRDPLAGYGRQAGDQSGGQGLWLVNQVCDLAEMRTSAAGTTIRIHMSLDGRGAAPATRERVDQAR